MVKHWMLLGIAVAVSMGSGCVGDQKVQHDAVAVAGQDSSALSRGQKPDITLTSGWDDKPDAAAPNPAAEHSASGEVVNAPSSASVLATVNTEAILYEEVHHYCLSQWLEAGKIPDETAQGKTGRDHEASP